MSRDCGGQGLCGKCRVQTPDLLVLEADRRVLGDTLCARGWRLGCQHAVRRSEERRVGKECRL